MHRKIPNHRVAQTWSADITYIWTGEGWLSLAVVLDQFNREIVGWSIRPPYDGGDRD